MMALVRGRPADLRAIEAAATAKRASGSYTYMEAGWIAAFADAAAEIQPALVLTEADRAAWIIARGRLRFALDTWVSTPERALGLEREVVRSMVEIAERSWRGPPLGPRRSLPFVRDERLRKIAERDLGSLRTALMADDVKPALILAGSTIEAMLLDVVLQDLGATATAAARVKAESLKKDPGGWKNFDPNESKKWSFHQYIAVCGPLGLGILPERAVNSSRAVKDYRNFAHPSKEIELAADDDLTHADAKIADGLAEHVIEALERWARRGP